ncbi:hypothetical protein EYZ11_002579 [Aspergillus tanneri]|uniref:PH domain-containing protein n=1 Tax=Aspergillus tanneri TaxID=1220188 RepID=A0A4S3JQJ7_9EURO|nr:uncharacterized protein ATNIH1004_001462 [Aspergillus tanneri]KAA8652557.1 hypothetical protein ATNIH1004_001462 [Aspergillus tanneri]THC97942.1 hypothetical protein EYZ11_002579 [Aspergillus tanneri]
MSQPLSPSREDAAKAPEIHLPDGTIQRSSRPLPVPPPASSYRNGHVNLDTFSPVNENGSFEFDRVLKTGKVNRRVKHKHAFSASWKPVYLVLRPNLLSVYKDEETTRLRLSITLSEVTAVASVKCPRSSRQHVFGIYSPSKNYRFQAASEKEADDWVARIRAETRVNEEEEAFLALSRKAKSMAAHNQRIDDTTDHSDMEQAGRASSPELGRALSPSYRSKYLDGQLDDVTSFSEWSDGPTSNATVNQRPITPIQNLSVSAPTGGYSPLSYDAGRHSESRVLRDPERVICNGYLQCLRIKGTVRQWKRLWVVLRPKSLAFYKDEQEYSAVKILPMSQVIDAAEVDPMSRSKHYCLQIIAEEKSFRLCAPDEESLTKWLGSLKSILVARKKQEPASGLGTAAMAA